MGEIIDGFLQESQQQTIRLFALSLVQRRPFFDIWEECPLAAKISSIETALAVGVLLLFCSVELPSLGT